MKKGKVRKAGPLNLWKGAISTLKDQLCYPSVCVGVFGDYLFNTHIVNYIPAGPIIEELDKKAC